MKGPEDDVPTDGKLDSFQKPTDKGPIAFGAPVTSKLASGADFQTWEFSLVGPAKVKLFTARTAHKASTDTVLYLYRKGASGTYGSYIARNDDADASTVFSSLAKTLDAGDYRLLVKGYASSTTGSFDVEAECTGGGCVAAPAPTCVFGSSLADWAANANLLNNGPTRLTSSAGLSALDAARIVSAYQESDPSVTTVDGAFAHADQHEIDISHLYDLAGARSYVVVDFGAGDNTYGAIFAEQTTTKVAAIHDGDFYSCVALAETCLLHQNLGDLASDPAWVVSNVRTVTSPAALSTTEQAQALAAILVTEPATSLANGFTLIDQGQLELKTLTHASGAQVVELDYGAGDNPYGAFFTGTSATPTAEIHDGDFYGCTLDK